MHAHSSKEWTHGREEILHLLEEENEAAFASSTSLPALLIIQSVLPLLLSALPLHGKGGGVRRGGFLIYLFILLLLWLGGGEGKVGCLAIVNH